VIGWPYGHVVRLLILTGARRAEVTRLEWRELDLEAAKWTLPAVRAKNKRQHDMLLSVAAVEILKGAPRISGSEFVFSFDGKKPLAGDLIKTRIDENLPDDMEEWRLHDLRRTFASGLARLGTPIHVVEKLLNHVGGSLSGIAGVYNRHYSYVDEQRSAVEAWGRCVEALAAGGPSSSIVELATTSE
jgi:integrase